VFTFADFNDPTPKTTNAIERKILQYKNNVRTVSKFGSVKSFEDSIKLYGFINNVNLSISKEIVAGVNTSITPLANYVNLDFLS
jgi:hypothetical protein